VDIKDSKYVCSNKNILNQISVVTFDVKSWANFRISRTPLVKITALSHILWLNTEH